MTYKLLALDLDDTLLGPDREVGERTKEAVRLAQDRGATVVLATGRPYCSARLYAERLGILGPVIASSGAVVRDVQGRDLREQFLPRELCSAVVEDCDQRGAAAYAYIGCQIWSNRSHPATDRYARILDVPIEVDDNLAQSLLSFSEEVNALALRVDPDSAAEIEAFWRRRLGDDAVVIGTLPTLVEILPSGGGKGSALGFVCCHLGIPIAASVAVGDSRGDIDMLQAAGLGVLVANAPPELHPEADRVTRSPFVEGVIEVVQEFFPKVPVTGRGMGGRRGSR